MNKKESIGIGAGSISILAIFVVLCLTTLSALSLVSAHADYSLAKKTASSMQEYYAADAIAEERLAELAGYVEQGYGWEMNAVGSGYNVLHKDGVTVVNYTVPINAGKNLYVEVELEIDDQGMTTGEWDRTVWQTQIVDRPEEEETLNVLQ